MTGILVILCLGAFVANDALFPTLPVRPVVKNMQLFVFLRVPSWINAAQNL